MAPATLVQRIPEDSPLYIPTPYAFGGIAAQDVATLAAGQDAMDTDINLAASGVGTEPDAQAALNGLLGNFDTATGDAISTQVDRTGMTLGSTITAGNGLLGAVDGLIPPADPTAPPTPAPGPGPSPAPAPAPEPPPDPGNDPGDQYCRDYYREDPLCQIR
jgi:hypothetical protein